jgi:hypothetical protein
MRASFYSVFATVCAVLFACICVLLTATLVAERSRDTIRLTVPADELLPSIGAIQGATGYVLEAVPLGEEDTAKEWRITINRNVKRR